MCTPAQSRAYDDMLAALQSVIAWYGTPPHHPAPAIVKALEAVAQAIAARPTQGAILMTDPTPGNWFIDRDEDEQGFTVSTDHGQIICSVLSSEDFPCIEEGTEAHMDDEARANALLIASAPNLLAAAELLEAAETAHANCPECEGEEIPELCPRCFPAFDDARVRRRLAIAKAKGPMAKFTEEACPGHVASESNPKVCGRCGTRVDSLRPPEELP